jgi:HPr kinase/phosphorylase
MLGLKIPVVNIPITSGKNTSVIVEVVALNHILKSGGYNAAQIMREKLAAEIEKKNKIK